MELRHIDAFAGIGGFTLGLKQACLDQGITYVGVAAIEFDTKCKKTYLVNHGIQPLGDITKLNYLDLPEFDILTGGFPCQPFSRNGYAYRSELTGEDKPNKTVRESDSRANLFRCLVDILVIKKPKFFVLENVKGILGVKNQDGESFLAVILEELARAGYTVTHFVASPAFWGVPQRRERVFFVGTRSDLSIDVAHIKPTMPNKSAECSVEALIEPIVAEKYFLNYLWRNRGLQVIEQFSTRLEALENSYNSREHQVRPGKINLLAAIYGDTPSGAARQQDKAYSIEGISPTILTFATPVFRIGGRFRILTPRECARLQSFPESFILPAKDSVAYKQLGNSVNVTVIYNIMRHLLGLYTPDA